MAFSLFRTGFLLFLLFRPTYAYEVPERSITKEFEYDNTYCKLLASGLEECLNMQLVRLCHAYVQSPSTTTQTAFIAELLAASESEQRNLLVTTLSLPESASALQRLAPEIPITFWQKLYAKNPSILSIFNKDILKSLPSLDWIQPEDAKYLAASEIDWLQSPDLLNSLPLSLLASLAADIPALFDVLHPESFECIMARWNWCQEPIFGWLVKSSRRLDKEAFNDHFGAVITAIEKAKRFSSDLLASFLAVIFESEITLGAWIKKTHTAWDVLVKAAGNTDISKELKEFNNIAHFSLQYAQSLAHNRRRVNRIIAAFRSGALPFFSSIDPENRSQIIDALQVLCSTPLHYDVWRGYRYCSSISTSLQGLSQYGEKAPTLPTLLNLPTKYQNIHCFVSVLLRALFADNPEDWSGGPREWEQRFKTFWSEPLSASQASGMSIMVAWDRLRPYVPRGFCGGETVLQILIGATQRMGSEELRFAQYHITIHFRPFKGHPRLLSVFGFGSEFALNSDIQWYSRKAAVRLEKGLLGEALPFLGRLHSLLTDPLAGEIESQMQASNCPEVLELALKLPQLLTESPQDGDFKPDASSKPSCNLETDTEEQSELMAEAELMTQADPMPEAEAMTKVDSIEVEPFTIVRTASPEIQITASCTKEACLAVSDYAEDAETPKTNAIKEMEEPVTELDTNPESKENLPQAENESSKKKKKKNKNKKKTKAKDSAELVNAITLEHIRAAKDASMLFLAELEADFAQSISGCHERYYSVYPLGKKVDYELIERGRQAFANQTPIDPTITPPSGVSARNMKISVIHPIFDEFPNWNMANWASDFNLQRFLSQTDYSFMKVEDLETIVNLKSHFLFQNSPEFLATASADVITATIGSDAIKLLSSQSLNALSKNPAVSAFPKLFPWILRGGASSAASHASVFELVKILRAEGLTVVNLASTLAYILHSEETIKEILNGVVSCFSCSETASPVMIKPVELDMKAIRIITLQRSLLSKALQDVQEKALENNSSVTLLNTLTMLRLLATIPLNDVMRMSYLKRGIGYYDKTTNMLRNCSPDLEVGGEFLAFCVAWRFVFDSDNVSNPLKVDTVVGPGNAGEVKLLSLLNEKVVVTSIYNGDSSQVSQWDTKKILDQLWIPLAQVIKSSGELFADYLEGILSARFLVHQMFGFGLSNINYRVGMGLYLARRTELIEYFDCQLLSKFVGYVQGLDNTGYLNEEVRIELRHFVNSVENFVSVSLKLWESRSLVTVGDLKMFKESLEDVANSFLVAYMTCYGFDSSSLDNYEVLFKARRNLSNMLACLGPNLDERDIELFNSSQYLKNALDYDSSILTKAQQQSLLASTAGREFLCTGGDILTGLHHFENVDAAMAHELSLPLSTIGAGLATVRPEAFAYALNAFDDIRFYKLCWRGPTVIKRFQELSFGDWSHRISFWWYILDPHEVDAQYCRSFQLVRHNSSLPFAERLQANFMYSITQELNFLWFYMIMELPELTATAPLLEKIRDAAKVIVSSETRNFSFKQCRETLNPDEQTQAFLSPELLAETPSRAFFTPQSILRQAIVEGIAEDKPLQPWIKDYAPSHFRVTELQSFAGLYHIVRGAFNDGDYSWIARFLLVNILDHTGARLNPEIKVGDLIFMIDHLSEPDRVLFMWVLMGLKIDLADYCGADWPCRDPVLAPESNILTGILKAPGKARPSKKK
jgi:hypothetical protein